MAKQIPIHEMGVLIAGAKMYPVTLNTPQDFLQQTIRILQSAKPRPKLLMVNFPSNPSAHCVELDFFIELVDLAKRYDLCIIHDFAYAELTYDGYQAPSILQVPGAKDVAVESYSLSKSYNMPGWRVGFICGAAPMIHALANQAHLCCCVPRRARLILALC